LIKVYQFYCVEYKSDNLGEAPTYAALKYGKMANRHEWENHVKNEEPTDDLEENRKQIILCDPNCTKDDIPDLHSLCVK